MLPLFLWFKVVLSLPLMFYFPALILDEIMGFFMSKRSLGIIWVPYAVRDWESVFKPYIASMLFYKT